MKKILLILISLFVLSFTVYSQSNSSNLKKLELYSVYDENGKSNYKLINKGCFSFITKANDCKRKDLSYGHLRIGSDWDWFQVFGEGSRNKIVKIGNFEWTDDFEIPIVEPYQKLKDGEKRKVFISADGKDGANGKKGKDGADGRNWDGTFNAKPIAETIQTEKSEITVEKESSETKLEQEVYQLFAEVILDNIYVMRIVEDDKDFYILFRVDELEKGHKCVISWKKIED